MGLFGVHGLRFRVSGWGLQRKVLRAKALRSGHREGVWAYLEGLGNLVSRLLRELVGLPQGL